MTDATHMPAGPSPEPSLHHQIGGGLMPGLTGPLAPGRADPAYAPPPSPHRPEDPVLDGPAVRAPRLPVDAEDEERLSPEPRGNGSGSRLGPTGRPVPRFPDPPPLEEHGNARIVALCNQKGGVGKTTTAISLGAALVEFGRKVLLVDFDPQGALSVGLGVNPHTLDGTIYNLLMERGVRFEDVVRPTRIPGLDLLPSNIDLSAAEVQLVGEVAREQALVRALRAAVPAYDVILIDCQPSLGLLTINALTASNSVIVPLECEFFALRGVALLLETIQKVQERLNPDLTVEGVLATMYDSRTLHTREVLARLVEAFGDTVFHTVVNRTVRFPDATVAGEPITTHATNSQGATAYRTLAKEVLARWRDE